MSISLIIKDLMKKKKVKKIRLSEHLGIARNTLDDYLAERTYLTSDKIEKLADYLEVPVSYLFGETSDGSVVATKRYSNSHTPINYEKKGSPYYDVDFIGGFDLLLNDQTVNPEYYIDIEPYNRKGIVWCNLYGKSMEPLLSSGDRIAILERKCTDVIFGKVYGIVTKSGLRTVKWVVRSEREEYWRLVPENKDPKFGDYQDLLIGDVFKVFEIVASVRSF